MITNSDLEVIQLSATKKDFYQIWNELIDTAKKLTNIWDPSATNESDPGIVLLKALTGIADKLNYTIDKNILEAFMPSAAQEESMRKLCNMLGYSMKYYQSAKTEVVISYNGSTPLPATGLYIPIFSTVKNADGDVNFVLLEGKYITSNLKQNTFEAIEGQIVRCETSTDNIVSMYNLDDNYRYILPESVIAENGIFIWNINDGKTEAWTKVDNLNSQPAESKVYTFGFDSKQQLPYIQFPADVAKLIEDGFEIYYIRTSGANGNISARTLSALNEPEGWDQLEGDESYSTEDFSVVNESSAKNGANPESLTDAYNNFKKTIGTFDTLVTCRDYMNKIYQLVDSGDTPLVSNILVTDLRDDINNAIQICGFDEYGICYTDTALTDASGNAKISNFDLILYPFKTVYGLNTYEEYTNSFKYSTDTLTEIEQDLENYKLISHTYKTPTDGDIICIKNYLKLNAKITTTYKVAYAEQQEVLANIRAAIYENFNMRKLDFGEEIPFDSILEVIQNADTRIKNVSLDEPDIYTNYEVYDSESTTGVKEYSLATSSSEDIATAKVLCNKTLLRNILAGRISIFDYNTEFQTALTEKTYTNGYYYDEATGKYVPVDAATNPERHIPDMCPPTDTGSSADLVIKDIKSYCNIDTSVLGGEPAKEITLLSGESIQFRAPNFTTEITYPAYVNYYLHLKSDSSIVEDGVIERYTPATFITLREFMNGSSESFATGQWNDIAKQYVKSTRTIPNINTISGYPSALTDVSGWGNIIETEIESDNPLENLLPLTKTYSYSYSLTTSAIDFITRVISTYGAIYYRTENSATENVNADPYTYYAITSLATFRNSIRFKGTDDIIRTAPVSKNDKVILPGNQLDNPNFFYIQLMQQSDLSVWKSWLASQDIPLTTYRVVNSSGGNTPGYLIDSDGVKYALKEQIGNPTYSTMYDYIYVPQTHTSTVIGSYTEDGLGKDATVQKIPANTEYELKSGEYLLLNYTESSSDSTDTSGDNVVNLCLKPSSDPNADPIIIRPNFDLYDTKNAHTYIGTSYCKKSGFDFSKYGAQYQPEGMFAFGADEQVEKINYARVKLDEVSYIYWNLNTNGTIDSNNSDDTYLFRTSDYDSATGIARRTLEDGEYVYYTDENMIDMAYYGSGSEIVVYNYSLAVPIKKNPTATNTSSESILENGIKTIPWVKCGFSKNGIYMYINEFQYITLLEDDKLSELGSLAGGKTILSNSWTKVSPITNKDIVAAYESDGTYSTIKKMNLVSTTVGWEIRSRLNLCFGPTTTQTLYSERDIIEINYMKSDGSPAQGRLAQTIVSPQRASASATEVTPVSVKGNFAVNVASDTLDFSEVDQTALSTNLKVKPLEETAFEIVGTDSSGKTINGFTIEQNNFGTNWTKISLSSLQLDPIQHITTHVSLTNKYNEDQLVGYTTYGLLMIYYIAPGGEGESPASNAYLTISATDTGLVIPTDIEIFNNSGSWWSGYVDTTTGAKKYFLKTGINVIKINRSCVLNIFPDSHGPTGTTVGSDIIILSELDLVNKSGDDELGINNSIIGYQQVEATSAGNQLLADINKYDVSHTFYYNVPVENSVAIDLLTDAIYEENNEVLNSPSVLYDYNNVNNKFVISEIDADYLVSGISIARSSKK